jgi:hypothetical protein
MVGLFQLSPIGPSPSHPSRFKVKTDYLAGVGVKLEFGAGGTPSEAAGAGRIGVDSVVQPVGAMSQD